MFVTHQATLDLLQSSMPPPVNAVQGDSGTRILELSLLSGGIPWEIPENTSVLIRYAAPSGEEGVYDTLPDGRRAWSAQENRLTMELAPQLCAAPGSIFLAVTLMQDQRQLTTFRLVLQVEPLSGEGNPGDYTNLSQWMNGWMEIHGKGEQGEPGVSPVIQTETIPGGHRVTITDVTGTQSFHVMDSNGEEIARLDADLASLEAHTTVDCIAAQGTSGIWTWRKWSSGIAECWGSTTFTTAITNSWGSMYEADTVGSVAYPFPFTDRPLEFVSIHDGVGKLMETTGRPSTVQSAVYFLVRPTAYETPKEYTISFFIMGKWK
ncbi:MAG TPA: hypothetical protein IAC31_03260 [Candidatus Faecousia intestinigallinarum]|nr:hypothetical protein [Candidatus Faecousia intestinigallinarum]